MTALNMIFTTAGINAAVAADTSSLQVKITEIAFGDTGWTPDASAAALQNEVERITIDSFTEVENVLNLTASLDGVSAFTIREVGAYLEDGTLFAIWSHDTDVFTAKTANVELILSLAISLSGVPAGSVTVEVANGSSLEIIARLIEIADIQVDIQTEQIGYAASQALQDSRLDVIEADIAALSVPANLESRLTALENFDAALVIPADRGSDVDDNITDIAALDVRVTQAEQDIAAAGVPANLESRLITLETFDANLTIPPDLSATVNGHASQLGGLGTASTHDVGTASNQVPRNDQVPVRYAALVHQDVETGTGPIRTFTHSSVGSLSITNGTLTLTQRHHYVRSAEDPGGTT